MHVFRSDGTELRRTWPWAEAVPIRVNGIGTKRARPLRLAIQLLEKQNHHVS